MASSLPALQIILPLLLLLGTCSANLIRGGQKEFDYFTLALTWSGTECLSVKDSCPTNACSRSEVETGFTINGLWPDYDDGTWPSCCEGAKYDENEISIISNDLSKYWPSYSCISSSACGSLDASDLAYEWAKHGTCSSPVLGNQYEYFSTALMLYFKYNILEILSESGYLPSNTAEYKVEGIISAIQSALKVTPVVKCKSDAVEQVQICFDKTLQLQECPSTASTCPSLVSLPIKNTIKPLETTNLSFRGI